MANVAVDFDGVVSDTHNIHGAGVVSNGRLVPAPMPGARDAINLLREHGHSVIIHSCNNPEWIEQWMQDHDIRYDSIWHGKGKPVAALYIDDRGFRFETWSSLLAVLPVLLPKEQ